MLKNSKRWSLLTELQRFLVRWHLFYFSCQTDFTEQVGLEPNRRCLSVVLRPHLVFFVCLLMSLEKKLFSLCLSNYWVHSLLFWLLFLFLLVLCSLFSVLMRIFQLRKHKDTQFLTNLFCGLRRFSRVIG